MASVRLVLKVHSPLMSDRELEVFYYGVTASPADECFHVEVVEQGRVYRLTLQSVVIDDWGVAHR
jgi:hypothetical protein